MTGDPAAMKRRLKVMMVIDVIAVLVALAAAVAYFKFALDWALVVFAVAMLAGFGAQIWFIVGLKRAGRGV